MNPYPNLKQLRLQHNFKQCYVADTLGMSQPEYSKLEAGIRKLDVPVIRDLCSLYDINSEDLLTSSITLAENPGVAYIKEAKPTPKDVKEFTDQVPHDVMMKMMENYSFLLESYLKQQKVQERIIGKLIGDGKQGEDEILSNQPEVKFELESKKTEKRKRVSHDG